MKQYKSVKEFFDEPISLKIRIKVSVQAFIINVAHYVKFWYSNQFGFMIVWGKNYEDRPYISLEVPFLMIQIFLKK